MSDGSDKQPFKKTEDFHASVFSLRVHFSDFLKPLFLTSVDYATEQRELRSCTELYGSNTSQTPHIMLHFSPHASALPRTYPYTSILWHGEQRLLKKGSREGGRSGRKMGAIKKPNTPVSSTSEVRPRTCQGNESRRVRPDHVKKHNPAGHNPPAIPGIKHF